MIGGHPHTFCVALGMIAVIAAKNGKEEAEDSRFGEPLPDIVEVHRPGELLPVDGAIGGKNHFGDEPSRTTSDQYEISAEQGDASGTWAQRVYPISV